MSITTRIIRIGNSKGIRIPKPLLEQMDANDRVTLRVKNGQLIVKPVENVRQRRAAAFKQGAESAQEEMLIPEKLQNHWDEEGWEW